MALPNRFGRRNVGDVSAFGSMASRSSSGSRLNPGPNRPGTGHAISRGGFLRGAGLAAAGVAAAGIGFGNVARAAGGECTVNAADYTPGPAQVAAIQNAVNTCDIVNLVGEFDFGEHKQHVECTDPDDIFTCRYVVDQQGGTVNITKNVKIYGLNDVNNNPPKIKNGFAPISCNNKVELTVSNIHFEGPAFAAILAYKSNGLEVSMCSIKDVKSSELRRGYVTGAFGIALTTDYAHNGLWDFDEIEGTVTIRENYIENMDVESFSPYHIPAGIQLAFNKANATISGNQIYDCASGVYVSSVEGNTTITDNIIHPGQLGIWAGITVEWWNIIPFTPGNSYISGNEIYCAHNTADGIAFENYILGRRNYPITATMVVTNNAVTMENTDYGALTCYGPTVNSVWTNNIVKGSMGWAIGILPDYAYNHLTAENNFFSHNDLNEAHSTMAHIFFDMGASYNRTENNYFPQDLSVVPGWINGGPGCVLLDSNANKNHIFENNLPHDPGVPAVCQQILGMQGNLIENDVGGWNPGMCANDNIPTRVYSNMVNMIANKRAAAAKKYSVMRDE